MYLFGFPAFVITVVNLSIHPGLNYSFKTVVLVFRSGALMHGDIVF